MKRIVLPLITGSLGVCVGLVLSGKDVTSALGTGGILSVISAITSGAVVDTKKQKEVNDLLDKLSESESTIKSLNRQSSDAEKNLPGLRTEIKTLKTELDKVTNVANAVRNIDAETLATLKKLNTENAQLRETVENLESELELWVTEHQSRLESEIEERVQTEVKRIRVEELEKIFNQQDALYKRARDIAERYQKWGKAVGEKHNINTQLLGGLSKGFLEQMGETKEDNLRILEGKDREIEALKQQKELLQREAKGVLVEPEKIDSKYNPDLMMGNDLCTHIYQVSQVPLRFCNAYTTEEGFTHLGFMASKGADCEAIANQVNRSVEAIRSLLGVYRIESVNASKVLEGIEVTIRRSRPVALKEEQIYRIMERSSACTEILRKALDHTKGGKPTMRVMASTGQGKGILVKNFIADWIRTESGEVWFSDPMDGSDQDHWNMPKAAKSSKEGSELLCEFVTEFKARKDKNSVRKDTPVLAVFDEFDKEHPDNDKDKVKKVWTAIRHHKMKLILIGQDGEVGESGWRWDEMGNCVMLFVGNSIGTGLKHREDLGISLADKKTLEKQKSQIQIYLEDKNQGLSSDVMYRVALLVENGKGKFLELPPALKGELTSDKATIVNTPWESLVETEKSTTTELKVCPVCGGGLRKSGEYMRCTNGNHTKEMGKKSFKL